jgi:Uma2 family endonuclease
MIGFPDWAIEILSKAEEAARRYNPDARIRLVRDGTGVRFDLIDEPEGSDVVVDREGFTLYVQNGLEGVVDVVEPHDRLILRSPEDLERSVREQH